MAVVGTLYKEMALKPSILDDYVKDRALSTQLGRARFTQPEDRCNVADAQHASRRHQQCGLRDA